MTKFELSPIEIIRFNQGILSHENDLLSVEEPLEIALKYFFEGQWLEKKLAVVMRTPGNDENLVTGFLYTEGIIHHISQLQSIEIVENQYDHEGLNANQILCTLQHNVQFDLNSIERHFYTTSSCGVCGKSSIDAVKIACPIIVPQNKWKIKSSELLLFNGKLKEEQKSFKFSGGIHASALFDCHGQFLFLREDVGRHNALDKLIGESMKMDLIPLFESILFLSGRVSFELVQKASMAGIRMICAVGAPSSLAVEMAQELDITLVGFLKENKFNVYSAAERVDFTS